jgi:hypothetical protein
LSTICQRHGWDLLVPLGAFAGSMISKRMAKATSTRQRTCVRLEAVRRGLLSLCACSVALILPGAAGAAQPPTLLNIEQQDRHPRATFSAPGADDATIYFASKPDRATDGSFLQENIKHLDFLTNDEIQRGLWLDEEQVDPGTYYVMMRATDYDCIGSPSCIDGYSGVLTLAVSKPSHTYRGGVQVFHYSHMVYLTLRVTRLGESLPYRVCWQLKSKRRRCVSDKVAGYSWNDSAEDTVTVRLQGMKRRTTFNWYVHGLRVASKPANTTRY